MKWPAMVLCLITVHLCYATNSKLNRMLQRLPKNIADNIPRVISNIKDRLRFQTKCIDDLGCFYNGPPWYDPDHRPLSVPPESAKDVTYHIFTPTDPKEGRDLQPNLESLRNSTFDPTLPTKILCYAFEPKEITIWQYHQVKDRMLEEGKCNVILPEYRKYMIMPFFQAVATSRVIGARIASLIMFLVENTVAKAESFHLIGYSLGAQIAAYAGKRVPNLGRITACDAAGPYFHGTAPEIHLTPDDALFVDSIHGDGGDNFFEGKGMAQPYAHMDFYLNDGKTQSRCFQQSDTPVIGPIINALRRFFTSSCDHITTFFVFYESILSENGCRFLAVNCSSYEDFQKGICTSDNAIVAEAGFHAKKIPSLPPRTKFFLNTNLNYPFCKKNSFIH